MFDYFTGTICGRLTVDAEIKSTKDGKMMTSFSVAANTKKDHSEFVSVVAFSPISQKAAEQMKKGDRVTVIGEIESYESQKDGKLRLRMTAEHIFPGVYLNADGGSNDDSKD